MTDVLTVAWHLRYVLAVALLLWTLAALAVGVPFGRMLAHGSRIVEAREQAALARQADDHGEPSRAQVELDWTFGGRLPHPDAPDEEFAAWVRQALRIAAPDPTPIYSDIAADRLRAELDDSAAVERWLA